MSANSLFLVFGATGRTGKHFISLALAEGHTVRALVRNPEKVSIQNSNLELHKGSIESYNELTDLLQGVQFVVCMLGDGEQQSHKKINLLFVEKLIPAMRERGVKRFLYQAGGLSRPYKERLPLISWILRNTIARYSGLLGQHEDNEAVIEYLVEEARDIDWIVHRLMRLSLRRKFFCQC